MSKRDYVSEILSMKKRLKKRSHRWAQVRPRLNQLQDFGDSLSKKPFRGKAYKYEIAKYISIGTVACIEGYIKLVYRDLIDHSSQFLNAAKKENEFKFSIDHVIALKEDEITLGEMISHLLSAKSVEEINKSLTQILGKPFLDDFWLFSYKRPNGEILEIGKLNPNNKFITELKRLFEIRNIFCHELATKSKISISEILYCSQTGVLFIWFLEKYITEHLKSAT